MVFIISVTVVDRSGQEIYISKRIKIRKQKEAGLRALRIALDEAGEDYPGWKKLDAGVERIEQS